MPEWMLDLALSDYLLFAALVGLLWFVIDYGALTPWWRWKRHGFIGFAVILFAFSQALLMGLIVYGVVMGERIGEQFRVIAAGGVLLGILAKIVILHYERNQGRTGRIRADDRPFVAEVARREEIHDRHHADADSGAA